MLTHSVNDIYKIGRQEMPTAKKARIRSEMLAALKARHRRAQITIIATAIAALAIFTAAIEFMAATQ